MYFLMDICLLPFYMKYFSEENLVTLAYEIVKGLAYLNKRGITHRNLSQENILFNKKVFVHEPVCDRSICIFVTECNLINTCTDILSMYLQIICNKHLF